MVKEFPSSPLEKIAREAGKPMGVDRVSASATRELRNTLLEVSDKIAADSLAAAHHARRVTIKREDIVLAARK